MGIIMSYQYIFKKSWKMSVLLILSLLSILFTPPVHAQSIADIAKQVEAQIPGVLNVIEGIAYILGIGLLIKGVFKLKEYNESNGQIKLSQPIIIILCAIILLTLGGAITAGRETLFGAGAGPGGGTGIGIKG